MISALNLAYAPTFRENGSTARDMRSQMNWGVSYLDSSQFTSNILKKTTPDELMIFIKSYFTTSLATKDVPFIFCDKNNTIFGAACEIRNFTLVKSLVEALNDPILRKEKINYSNSYGMTALFTLARTPIESDLSIQIAQYLIENGANINSPTSSKFVYNNGSEIPAKATPLWIALEKSNIQFAYFLLQKGALINPELTETGKQVLKKSYLNIQVFLAGVFKKDNFECPLKKFPLEVVKIIFEYVIGKSILALKKN